MKINLSKDVINEKVCEWANFNGNEMQKRNSIVPSWTEWEVDRNRTFYFSDSAVNMYLNELENMVMNAIIKVIPSISSYSISSFFDVTIKRYDDGKVYVHIFFDSDALKRESLNPSSEGVNNIVALFANGYDVKKCKPPYPYGIWHGKKTYALRHREHNDFLYDVINEFNQMYGGNIYALLDDKYTTTRTEISKKQWDELMNKK